MGRVRVPPPLRCAWPAPQGRASLRRSGGTRPRCGGPPGYSPGSPRVCGVRPVPRRPRAWAWSPWALVRPLLARQLRPVASYLGPVPGSLVGPGRPSASPAGVPPGSTARPPAASFLRPRGAALCVPAPAGPPSAPVRAPSGRPSSAPAGRPSSGPLAGSPPPAASACRAGSRPNGGRFGRPPPPRGFGGPPVPPLGGGPGPRLCGAAPRGFCAAALLGGSPPALGPPLVLRASPGAAAGRGLLPFPLPAPPPPLGEGEGTGPDGWQAPQRGPLFADPSGPPGPIRALPGWGCASPVDFPKIVNRPAAHDCERAVKGK